MERYVSSGFFPFFLFLFLFLVPSVLSQLPLNQRTTMVNLASKLTSSKWNTTDPDPCSWKGVSCSSNSITHLSFSNFELTNGSVLFLGLCNLTSLQVLDFSMNFFTSIPTDSLGSCGFTDLKMLNFSWNHLSGILPSFQDLGSLETLDLSHNQINGIVVSQFEGLIQLKSLNLSFNSLNGPVPTNFGKGMVLKELQLSINRFSGVIPEGLLDYTNLTLLDLSLNHLSGFIPDKIEKLSKLEILILSLNNLAGDIPQSLSRITTLYRFAANQNSFSGAIPSGISSHLRFLDLSYNRLNGSILDDLLSSADLLSVDLTSNSLKGTIPTDISSNLFRLRLANNFLSGGVPRTIGSVTNLAYLEIDNNNLTGGIPVELQNCSKLQLLSLSQNDLNGSLPSQLGDLSQLEVMKLDRNKLTGEIPEGFSQLEKLLILDLSQNYLTGSIPSTISKLSKLSNLNLESNELTGSIPDTFVNLNSLLELQLGHNRLSGPIPRMAPNLQLSLNLSSNYFQGSIPSTLSGLSNLEVLDLSNNGFTGEVPDFLTGMGSLTTLVLSNNRLSGTLPRFKPFVVVNATGNNDLIIENPNISPTPTILHKSQIRAALVAGVVVTGAVFGIGLAIIVVLVVRHRYPSVIKSGMLNFYSTNISNIDFTRAMKAVTDPANIMFKTRFSAHYKAIMPSGICYSVKRLDQNKETFRILGHDKFKDELEILSRLSNENIMTPLAYLLSSSRAYLFYEYIHKGTLFDFLHSSLGSMLDWPCRHSIALGVARGLAFLHGCTHPILHLDLSTRSVLLKSPKEPQIADIELCKIIDPSKSNGSLSVVAGSVGYSPPEYPYTMRVTMAGNVYSFGVILLELLTGKPPVSEGIELAKWVLSTPTRHEPWEQILDPSMRNTSLEVCNEMLSMLKVALDCVSLLPEARPEMTTVVRKLAS